MTGAVYAFTDAGRQIAETLLRLPGHRLYRSERSALPSDFASADALVFVCATGIAVRLIAPLIQSKKSDPAVIVVDDTCRFTISLLSGHLGGANALAEEIAIFLGNTPVITTASDNRGMEALDVFAKRQKLLITNFDDMKTVMTDIVNGKRVGYYSEIEAEPIGVQFVKTNDVTREDVNSWVIISVKKFAVKKPCCYLVPKNLYLGVGCKKDTTFECVYEAVAAACEQVAVDIRGIAQIATIELKRFEAGLIKAAERLGAAFKVYSNNEVNSVPIADEDKSDFVYRNTGVYAVSEPCAKLSGGTLLLKKFIRDGVTVSIAHVHRH
jgi:cobalamin (vitamin B12) biosynthesis cbiG protein